MSLKKIQKETLGACFVCDKVYTYCPNLSSMIDVQQWNIYREWLTRRTHQCLWWPPPPPSASQTPPSPASLSRGSSSTPAGRRGSWWRCSPSTPPSSPTSTPTTRNMATQEGPKNGNNHKSNIKLTNAIKRQRIVQNFETSQFFNSNIIWWQKTVTYRKCIFLYIFQLFSWIWHKHLIRATFWNNLFYSLVLIFQNKNWTGAIFCHHTHLKLQKFSQLGGGIVYFPFSVRIQDDILVFVHI